MPRDPLIISRMPPDLIARIDEHATSTGTTRSAIIRAALTNYLAPPNPTRTPTRSNPAGRAPRRDATCQHRVKPGNYCPKCAAIVL